MAWNGSEAGPVPKAGATPPLPGVSRVCGAAHPRGPLAAQVSFVLVSLALLALVAAGWLLYGRFAGGVAAGSVPTAAPTNAPCPAALPQGSVPGPTASEARTATPGKSVQPRTYRDARGVLRYEGGARVPGQRPLAKPIELGSHRPEVFRHAAEEHISWLLDMRVGEPVVGDYAYGDAFRRSFRESLAEPVEILDTDDARTRELKAAVQETKEELRRRMEAGEDVAKIMNDTMDEFRRLARYRRELQSQLHEVRADGERYSEQDVEDFTRAANEMLGREGLPPLAMPRALMRGLRQR